jgi:hypothetical protein
MAAHRSREVIARERGQQESDREAVLNFVRAHSGVPCHLIAKGLGKPPQAITGHLRALVRGGWLFSVYLKRGDSLFYPDALTRDRAQAQVSAEEVLRKKKSRLDKLGELNPFTLFKREPKQVPKTKIVFSKDVVITVPPTAIISVKTPGGWVRRTVNKGDINRLIKGKRAAVSNEQESESSTDGSYPD